MFKFELGKIVHYLKDNKPHSAKILSRIYIDNQIKEVHTKEQLNSFQRFGEDTKMYATIHGEFLEDNLFESKKELAESIFKE